MNIVTTPTPKNVLPKPLQEHWDRLCAMDAEQLDAEFEAAVEAGVAAHIRLALVIGQKEERGEDLAEIKRRIGTLTVGYLRKIRCGQLLPDAFTRFGARPRLLRAVAALPLPDQRLAVQEQGVKLGQVTDDGSVTHTVKDPNDLSDRQIKQVFADDHIRDPDEQIAWLRRNPPRPKFASPITVDKRHKEIVVTGEGVRISREQLLMYLASLG